MYSVLYVLVDNKELGLYNEMMKSILSLKMRMPEKSIVVLMDADTYNFVQESHGEVFQMAEVVSVTIRGDYSQVEKSRYLKTKARQIVRGDFLYIDTDTVICEKLPDIVSEASIGLVLELHNLKSVAKSPMADIYDAKCKIEKSSYDLYYNSGVMWAKDDSIAIEFCQEWNAKWEETRKSGLYRDQPPLNYVIRNNPSRVDTLNDSWNVQISTKIYTPVHLVSGAYILHYMDNEWSSYSLCRPQYKKMKYNDPVIIEMLKHPRTLFERSRLLRLDDNNQYEERELKEYEAVKNSRQYHLLLRIKRAKWLFRFNENILGVGSRIKQIFVRK